MVRLLAAALFLSAATLASADEKLDVVETDDGNIVLIESEADDGGLSIEVSESAEDSVKTSGLLSALGRVLFGGSSEKAEATGESEIADPTHRQIRTLKPKVAGKTGHVVTFKTTPDGLIFAAVTEPFGDSHAVQLINFEGEVVKSASLDGPGSAVAIAPDGTMYVAAGGKIVQLDADLKTVKSISSPHIGDPEEFRAKVAESIRKESVGGAEIFEEQLATMQKAVEKIEAKDEPTRVDKARLRMYRQQVEIFEDLIAQASGPAEIDDSMVEDAVQYAMTVTSMAASDDYVFVCANPGEGYSKSVFRVSRDFGDEEAKVVLSDMSGCCGQFDIQCCEDGLVCSENTRFKVAFYDFDGEAQSSFGSRDRSSRAGFGSCCNPMNSLPLTDGSVLAAESSLGHIKRFDGDGNLLAYVGKAKIGGGCKHCCMGYDAERDLYYMLSQSAGEICVLGSIADHPLTEQDRIAAVYEQAVYTRLAGQWVPANDDSTTAIDYAGTPQVAMNLLRFDGRTADMLFQSDANGYYSGSLVLGEPTEDGEVGTALMVEMPTGSEEPAELQFTFVAPNTLDLRIGDSAARYVRTVGASGESCESDSCDAGTETGGSCCVTAGTGDASEGPAVCVTDRQ